MPTDLESATSAEPGAAPTSQPAAGEDGLSGPQDPAVEEEGERSMSDLSSIGEMELSVYDQEGMVNSGDVQEIMSEEFSDLDDVYWAEEVISNELIAGPLLALKVHLLGEWGGASSLPEISEIFLPDAQISAFTPGEFDESELTQGVMRRDWKGETNYLSLADWQAALAAEHEASTRVRWAVCKPAYVSLEGEVAILTMKYRFNRELKAGGIRHDHGYWESEWVKNEDGEWRCRKMGPQKSCYTVESEAPHFVDVTGEALAGTYYDPRLPKEMKGINRSLAVADIDSDGDMDLLTMLPMRMLFNRGDGTFEDRTVELLEREHSALEVNAPFNSSLVADFDRDGDMDFVCSGKARRATMFIQQPNGKFLSKEVGPKNLNHISGSLSAHDVDEDGWLDIFICGYGPFIDPGPNDPTSATNGRRNVMLKNMGPKMGFRVMTKPWGLLEEGERWAFIGAWGDADEDGDIDLYVANDFGPNVLYRRDNTEEVHFTAELQDKEATDIGFSMSATWSDLDGDLDNDLYVSNMASTAAQRVSAMAGDPTQSETIGMDMNAVRLKMSKGNTIYMQGEDNRLAEGSSDQGARGASWAWGTAVFDYDCDGDVDIHCVNGFWSQGADDGRDL
ncbi:MAG: VCBS repeat-containing protein [Planctomycetota bacterium]|nr:VCBS repeat-containing protein [Planctomycetota bacterium]